jgi:hypothetical protein
MSAREHRRTQVPATVSCSSKHQPCQGFGLAGLIRWRAEASVSSETYFAFSKSPMLQLLSK